MPEPTPSPERSSSDAYFSWDHWTSAKFDGLCGYIIVAFLVVGLAHTWTAGAFATLPAIALGLYGGSTNGIAAAIQTTIGEILNVVAFVVEIVRLIAGIIELISFFLMF